MNRTLFRSLKSKRHQQRIQEKREERERQQEENRRRTGCDSKEKVSQAVARQRARALSLQLNESIQPYECEFCGYWHVGHRR